MTKRPPTSAGAPITAHGSGELVTGLLRSMGWGRTGRADAKLAILAPGAHAVERLSRARRILVSGWVLQLQIIDDVGHWCTRRKVGALDAMREIAYYGTPDGLFVGILDEKFQQKGA